MSVGAVNKQTGERIPTAGMPAIDNALSATSTNPVQNAIITAALANKQDKTDNSLQTTDKTVVGAVNELKSGLTNINVELSVPDGTGKNILTNTATTTTTNGVTFTVNDDGTVTLNGETTATDTNFTILNPWVKVGNYVLNGVPSTAPNGTKLQAFMTGKTVEDTGSGVALNVVAGDSYRIRITITGTGIVFDNVTIKPMIRLASVTDPTYTPYIPSVESRIEAVESGLTNVANQIVGVKAGYLSSSNGDTVYIPAKVYPRVLIVLNNQGTDGTNGRPTIVGVLSMGQSGAYRFEQITNVTDYALTFTYDNVTDPDNPRFAVQYIKVSDSTPHAYLRGFYLTADLRWTS
jgi:hypothetical protein